MKITDEDLSELLDALNGRFRDVEAELALRSGANVRAEVPCAEGILSYGKLGSGWRLLWRPMSDGKFEFCDEPLRNKSILIRIEAAEKLPLLLAAMDRQVIKTQKSVAVAIARVEAALKGLKGKG